MRTKKEKPIDEIAFVDKSSGRLTRIEYELKGYFEYDQESKKDVCVFEIQTFKEFSTFKYNLILDIVKTSELLKINLLGISAPTILFPFSGKASAKIKLFDVSGNYSVQIVKQDGTSNVFEFRIDTDQENVLFIKEIISEKKKVKKFIQYLEN